MEKLLGLPYSENTQIRYAFAFWSDIENIILLRKLGNAVVDIAASSWTGLQVGLKSNRISCWYDYEKHGSYSSYNKGAHSTPEIPYNNTLWTRF